MTSLIAVISTGAVLWFLGRDLIRFYFREKERFLISIGEKQHGMEG